MSEILIKTESNIDHTILQEINIPIQQVFIVICNYCKKEFKNDASLYKHQRTASYCLKIQKEPFVLKLPAIVMSYISLTIALFLYIKLLSFIFESNNKNNKYLISIFYGFLFGFAIYGTYSYTSCTYYKNYKYYDAFKDTLWGIILFIICGLSYTYLSS